MATFFLITLVISIVGLVSLLALKRYELVSGRTLLRGMRPTLDDVSLHSLRLIEHILPGALHKGGKHSARALGRLVRGLWSRVMHYCEQVLEALLHRVRRWVQPRHSNKEASQFLREVSDHKRKLEESTKDRAIFEE